ncbi:hypothetical protein FS837_010484 [Tulasnella sp. UAMH 9824]|nr:hypothetical protein FS837_010484 [Tulasnella sp. UAMH 9824]
MTTDPEELWDDQSISDYLKQELEFTSSVFAGIAQTHDEWKAHKNINSSARRFLGIVFAAITDWKRAISLMPPEEMSEKGEEYIIDDPKDSAYRENWIPTSLYRWAFLNLKHDFVDLSNDEILDKLVKRLRTAQRDEVELFDPGSHGPDPPLQSQQPQPGSLTLENETRTGPALIHRLPPEILSGVFILASDDVMYFPIIISHVDSRFRKIAEYTTLLWTRVDVNLPLPLVELYLKRSKTALLDVRIDLAGGNRLRDAASRLSAFIALFAGHTERISALSMSAFNSGTVDYMVEAMLKGLGSTYPQLRRLDTGCPIREGTRYPPMEYPVLAPPLLRELSIWGFRSRDWVSGFPEPMGALKSLCMGNNVNLFLEDLVTVLTKLPNLETLVIQDCTTELEPVEELPSVILPNLTTLQCVSLDSNSITLILEVLLTPKLTFLKVWWECGFKGWSGQAGPLVEMLDANPQLERLDLCYCVIQQEEWSEAFESAGSLKYLRLRSCELESDDLETLSEMGVGEDGEQCLLPHLEHLVLENVFHVSTEDIRRIVMHRPGLRSLELRGWDGTNVAEEDVQFIRQSVECFVLETFYTGLGTLEEEEEDGENEEWSSSGTPSEGSWLSGDEEVITRHVVTANAGGGQSANVT